MDSKYLEHTHLYGHGTRLLQKDYSVLPGTSVWSRFLRKAISRCILVHDARTTVPGVSSSTELNITHKIPRIEFLVKLFAVAKQKLPGSMVALGISWTAKSFLVVPAQ